MIGCGANTYVDESWDDDVPPPASCEADSSVVTVLASGQRMPLGIAVDDQFVYWANAIEEWPPPDEPGTVMRVSVDGGSVVELAQDPTQPLRVALDHDSVYWISSGGRIGKVLKNGGASEVLFEGSHFRSIASDDEHVYAGQPMPGAGALVRVKLMGGEAETLTDAEGTWAASVLAVDAGSIYWSQSSRERLMTASKTSMAPSTFYGAPAEDVPDQRTIAGITTDEHNVYWAVWRTCGVDEGAIVSAAKIGGEPQVLVSGPDLCTANLAVDDEWVYWTEPMAGRVMKVSKIGGEPVVIACNQVMPVELAIDGAYLYWTTTEGGTVMKAPK